MALWERCGGKDFFSRGDSSSVAREIRTLLVHNDTFPGALYLDFVADYPMTKDELYPFADHPEVFKDSALFKRFWKIDRKIMFRALDYLATKMLVDHPNFKKFHAYHYLSHWERCEEEPGRHYFCQREDLFDTVSARAFHKKFRNEFLALMGEEIMDLVHGEILKLPMVERSFYARSLYVHDDHWEILRQDHRQVLNELAANRLLPLPIARDIVENHKTPGLRHAIARHSDNKELLDQIYNGTSSEGIRLTVTENAVSGRRTIPGFMGA